jgi:hypothetical protein
VIFNHKRQKKRVKRVQQYTTKRKKLLKELLSPKTDEDDSEFLLTDYDAHDTVGIKGSFLNDLYSSSDEEVDEDDQEDLYYTPKVVLVSVY